MVWHSNRGDAYLEALRQRVLVFDGGMGTSLQAQNLGPEDFGGKALEGCNDYLCLVKPSVIESIHLSFLEVGCDVLETATFQATRRRLTEWGLGEQTLEINREGARIARRLADAYSSTARPRFVAGSMGPTGMLPSSEDPSLSAISFDDLAEEFALQSQGLIAGGADLLLIETSQDILEVRAAVSGIRRTFQRLGVELPIQAQVSLDTSGRMLLGTDVAAALVILEAMGVDVVGLNCSTGPEHMREPVRYLSEHSRTPISVIPNAGIPINLGGGKARYPLEPVPMAEALQEFVVRFGVSAVGGCCGTTPDHMQEVVKRVSGKRPMERTPVSVPSVASGIRAVALIQEPPPLLIGERVNTQGSRAVKRLLLADDYEGVMEIAREQMEGGAHLLDVCVALTERTDEAQQMRELVHRLGARTEAPLVIDSTEADVVKAALEAYPGRAVINSINLENGRKRIDSVTPMAKEHGAVLVALTIDEQGMAKTAERKLEVAKRIYDIVVGEYGMAPYDLIYDVLTFTLGTGDEEFKESAVATLEGIRAIKAELPGVLTSLGVSNVSFGLSPRARAVLNSVFLFHAVKSGLDMAIVNPTHTAPYAEIPEQERRLAEDLIFNAHPEALPAFIAHFEAAGAVKQERVDEDADLPVAERIHYRILHRKKEGIEDLLDQAMAEGRSAVDVLNDILLPAMKDVGDRFGAGELILPYVLQSAEVMKRAVRHLEQFLEKKEGYTKGRVVLATVYGDVHDIGKSLVNTILSNNGYTVYDLGKQVPVNTIIEKALEVDATAIGLSALLVSTSKQMPLCVQELAERGLKYPVIIGGAAINRSFGRRTAWLPEGGLYEPGVFYAKDAFEGLELMDQLIDRDRSGQLLERYRREAEEQQAADAGRPSRAPVVEVPGGRSAVQPVAPPRTPFLGVRRLEADLCEVFRCVDTNSLFRLHWGGHRASADQYQELVEREFKPLFRRMQLEAADEGYLHADVVYGYFPAGADGEAVVVFDPSAPDRELTRFLFPRQGGGERLCLADYFQPLNGKERDVLALQAVTVGREAEHLVERLEKEEGEYTRGYLIRGLAAATSEGLAEYTNRHIRAELGLGQERGRRYSWGYPACPDLEEQEKALALLGAEKAIGLSLTSAFQLDPEWSTVALVVHHPDAKYFAVRQT
jgi:5-methyltetrahydrofolate--homocysteine methyltransferase